MQLSSKKESRHQRIERALRNNLRKKFRLKSPKILYGGSVNPKNVKILKEINVIDGFLIGGASQDPKKFIDIVKKTFN